MSKRKRRLFLAALIAAILLSFIAVNHRALLSAAGRWLDVGERPQKSDAVILLNGSYNTRPFTAAALVRGGWAPKVLLSTVAVHALEADGALPPQHEIAIRVLEYAGVERSEVATLEKSAKTTFDEAEAVSEYLATHPAKRLILVTEGPHTRRSRWIFEQVLGPKRPEIVVVSAPTEGFDYALWWRSKDGFLFVVSEYFKLFFYALRYGWVGYGIAAAVIALIVLRVGFKRPRKPVSNGSVI